MIRVCFIDGRPSKWIEDTEMKTAEEVAKVFIEYWKEDFRIAPLTDLLDAYAEERVNEDRDKRTVDDLYKRSRKIGRDEALEEAAKIAYDLTVSGNRCGEIAQEAIRALKGKP